MGGVKPKKHLGQHFLNDSFIAERIVGSLSLLEEVHNVLEIGPGKGVLSEYLLQNENLNCRFVELDDEAAHYFQNEFPKAIPRLIIADFLKLDLKDIFSEPFLVIGNFPYNISTQIIFKVIEHRNMIPELVGMFQKEVADRICAPPGSKIYGLTSVIVQTFYATESLFNVSAALFDPPPKVESSVIRLKRNDFKLDSELYLRIIKAAFNQRRKTLSNALKQIINEKGAKDVPYLNKRAEQLGVNEFLEILAAFP